MSPNEPDDSENEGRRSLSEGLKKVLGSGVNALFVTEEGVRSTLSDLRLPKDLLQFVMSQTERTRREVTGIITKELKDALESQALLGGIKKALKGLKVQVRAEVTFHDAGAKTKSNTKVKTRRPAGETRRRRSERER